MADSKAAGGKQGGRWVDAELYCKHSSLGTKVFFFLYGDEGGISEEGKQREDLGSSIFLNEA